MLKAQKIFRQSYRKLTIVLLAGFIWFMSLPTSSVQAEGYYQEKSHNVAVSKPYYGNKSRKLIVQTEAIKPYYSTKERKQQKVMIKTPTTVDHSIESRKRSEEIIPKN
ncbi:MAG TPA: hypothetical protein VE956_11270 [Nodularia sp. (in: cyanobacteria)]|nr:hypothetical protein [Nodularia sp. (in: cyanobacteria)]